MSTMLFFLILVGGFNCWWEIMNFLILGLSFFVFKTWMFNYYTMLSYSMGGDVLTWSLVMLSFLIVSLMVLASFSIYSLNDYSNEFVIICIVLLLILTFTFKTVNLFSLYLFFESSLIPTLFLIFGWGYQAERLHAGFYLLFYTLFASLPLLLAIVYLYIMSGSVFYFYTFNVYNVYVYMAMVLVFLIKLPVFLFHFWLLSAHVEAPISGSMVLAGVLLKLGGYGLIRIMSIIYSGCIIYSNYFISYSLFSMLVVGFICMFQTDMSILIAYSSVSHMGFVICGIMSLNQWGVLGSLVLMVAHGLCSSGMFVLANIVYERSHSRSLFINKGMILFMPSMSLMWFLLSVNNMASPPSLNLMGELILFNSIVSWSGFSFVFLMLISFLNCGYSIYLYSMTQHGVIYSGKLGGSNGYVREYLLVLFHWLPLNFLFLKYDLFSFWF